MDPLADNLWIGLVSVHLLGRFRIAPLVLCHLNRYMAWRGGGGEITGPVPKIPNFQGRSDR